MRKRNKSILVTGVIILFVIAVIVWGAMIGAGPYGYAEQYKFNIDKAHLIKAVKKLKDENRSFNLPDEVNDPDRLDTLDMHYYACVYDYEQKTIFVFFIEGDYDNPNSAFINLISVNKSLDVRNYKIVNKNIDRAENLQVKKEFEVKFLDKLKLDYKDKGNGNFIFWK